jgi:hypothetical protein
MTMLVPADMIGPQSKLMFQVNKFYGDRVQLRKYNIAKTIREVCKVVQDVLKEVEVQEPRFISSLTDINGRYEGVDVISPTEFEVVLYLNQVYKEAILWISFGRNFRPEFHEMKKIGFGKNKF